MIALSWILEFSSQLMFTATVLGTLASGKKNRSLWQPEVVTGC